jgi:peptidoglycan/LPS O-acetylase OafA/YrhL
VSASDAVEPGDLSVIPLGHRPPLDGIRAAAIIVVMLFHTRLRLTHGGFIGVTMFFVLSGFLITRLLLDEHRVTGTVSWRGFYSRRALRLLPPLWVLAIASALLAPVNGDTLADLGRAAAAFFYVGNWVLAATSETAMGHLGHTWSLGIEEQFYLLWPATGVWLWRRWGTNGLVAGALLLSGASVVGRLVAYNGPADYTLVEVGLHFRLDALLLGAALAALIHRLPRRGWGLPAWTSAALLGLFVVGIADPKAEWILHWGLLAAEVATVIIICHVVQQPHSTMARMLSWRPATWTGRISYGLYLWHIPVYVALRAGPVPPRPGVMVVVGIPLTFLVAAASYRWIEQPFLARKPRPAALTRLPAEQ